MSDNKTRREFLRSMGGASVAFAGAVTVAAVASRTGQAMANEPVKEAVAALHCSDTKGLTDAEKGMRTALKYADTVEDATRECVKCQLYIPEAKAGTCGGCQILKGTIHPKGTCASWSAKVG